VIPTLWLRDDDKYSYWPRKDTRNCIMKCKKPQNDWIIYPVTIIAKYGMYLCMYTYTYVYVCVCTHDK